MSTELRARLAALAKPLPGEVVGVRRLDDFDGRQQWLLVVDRPPRRKDVLPLIHGVRVEE